MDSHSTGDGDNASECNATIVQDINTNNDGISENNTMAHILSKKEQSSSQKNIAEECTSERGSVNEGFEDENVEEKGAHDSHEVESDTVNEQVNSEKSTPEKKVNNQDIATTSKSAYSSEEERFSHSRGLSSASIGFGVGQSHTASTDGSTIGPRTPSGTDSWRGTYSEAPTLPMGMALEGTPIMEENGTSVQISGKLKNGYDRNSKDHDDVLMPKFMKFVRPVVKKYNALPPDPSKLDRIKHACLCPPHGQMGRLLTCIVLLLLFWGTLVYTTGEKALPGGTFFSLIVLVICAQIGGNIVEKVRLPPLLGMLLIGILFRNINVFGPNGIEQSWSSGMRSMALTVILIRAGLGLDPSALRKLSFVVLRLAMAPCLVESIAVAVMSHFLLGLPWVWGFMLGFILAAVSPAVVVPCLLNLSDLGYGVEKGIPTLVIAAASIDDVLAISGFGVCLGITFSEGSAVWQGMKGPIEFIMGIAFGIIVGFVLWLLPHKKESDTSFIRFLLLFFAGLFAVFCSRGIDFGGAGALGCLSVAFVAGVGWRNQGLPQGQKPVGDYFNSLWKFFQPMLFGLIGTEIMLAKLDVNTVGLGIACLVVGLTLRVITSFFAVMGGNLNLKERLFVSLAWLPKATVQAAIGSTALDIAATIVDPELREVAEMRGLQVLTIAVLVILITAPIGAIAIMLSAPKLLKRKIPEENGEITA